MTRLELKHIESTVRDLAKRTITSENRELNLMSLCTKKNYYIFDNSHEDFRVDFVVDSPGYMT